MTQVIQAIFEDGVLKPLQQLQLSDHTQVRLTVETIDTIESSGIVATTTDPLTGLRVATGITNLAERFDDYRFGRTSP
jgi:predicted DNA-binding antitoxin AbrB/MazE fold protein